MDYEDLKDKVTETLDEMFGDMDDDRFKKVNLAAMLATSFLESGETYWELINPTVRRELMDLMSVLLDTGVAVAERELERHLPREC